MNPNELKTLVEEIDLECIELLRLKGEDYSNEVDPLNNFKKISTICEILDINTTRDAQDATLFLVVLKLTRWCNLRNKSESPKNEPIRGTIVDLHNYINLGYACGEERENTGTV